MKLPQIKIELQARLASTRAKIKKVNEDLAAQIKAEKEELRTNQKDATRFSTANFSMTERWFNMNMELSFLAGQIQVLTETLKNLFGASTRNNKTD